MPRPIWCRFCGHPAQITAGVFPVACEKCDGEGHWSTQPPSVYLEPVKGKKGPRVPFDLTQNDRRWLAQLRIAAI